MQHAFIAMIITLIDAIFGQPFFLSLKVKKSLKQSLSKWSRNLKQPIKNGPKFSRFLGIFIKEQIVSPSFRLLNLDNFLFSFINGTSSSSAISLDRQ